MVFFSKHSLFQSFHMTKFYMFNAIRQFTSTVTTRALTTQWAKRVLFTLAPNVCERLLADKGYLVQHEQVFVTFQAASSNILYSM